MRIVLVGLRARGAVLLADLFARSSVLDVRQDRQGVSFMFQRVLRSFVIGIACFAGSQSFSPVSAQACGAGCNWYITASGYGFWWCPPVQAGYTACVINGNNQCTPYGVCSPGHPGP